MRLFTTATTIIITCGLMNCVSALRLVWLCAVWRAPLFFFFAMLCVMHPLITGRHKWKLNNFQVISVQARFRSRIRSSARFIAQTSARFQAHSSARFLVQSSARFGAQSSARFQAQSSARFRAQSSARFRAQSSARFQAQSSARFQAQSRARTTWPYYHISVPKMEFRLFDKLRLLSGRGPLWSWSRLVWSWNNNWPI